MLEALGWGLLAQSSLLVAGLLVCWVTVPTKVIGILGGFGALLALGSEGTQTALIMLVIVLLANGLLQNVVQPIAFGATLRMNPLLVLVTTIGFGAIFGMFGLVLGAPVTSAAIHISGDLARAKAAAAAANAEAEGGAEPSSGVGEVLLPEAP
jgi:putative heme transporter